MNESGDGQAMKVAIIGAGLQGKRRASAIVNHGDKIVRVVDKDIRLAKSLAPSPSCLVSRDWHDAVSDPAVEAVVVCTPNDLHAQISIAALAAGKHVLCEKPLARNPREASRVLKAETKSGARLKCGFNLRYHPALSEAKGAFDKGMIGPIYHMRCRYGISGRPDFDKDWRMERAISGGGQLMDQGVHVLDLFRWFVGDFTNVLGIIATLHWKTKSVEDNAFALLRTSSGQVASMHVSWTEWKNLFSFEVFGKNGYLKAEGLGGSYGVEKFIFGVRSSGPFRQTVTEFRGEDKSWLKEWRSFRLGIEKGVDFGGGGADGLAAVRLADAIYRSARSGREVRMA